MSTAMAIQTILDSLEPRVLHVLEFAIVIFNLSMVILIVRVIRNRRKANQ